MRLLATASPEEDTVDLDSMTKAQLLEYAEANGITGVSASMRKADILTAIKEVTA
ncbi:MAG: Rho termination factor N-terminal domain-containing protein [Oscillospiraceae bacterium]|nr:Rho termination factor N-terminal domain-containing protein [Oscillospiraceae bacterium]